MNETLYKRLEPTQTIENALPKIIEAFVSFYGEENRSYIENKFKNMLVIGYGHPKHLSYVLSNIKKNITEELIESFFDKLNIPIDSRKELRVKLFSNYNLDYPSLIPLQQYINYKEISKKDYFYEYTKNRAFQFLKEINPNITLENMEDLEKEGFFSDIDKLIPLYKDIMNLYNEEIKKLSKYIEENEHNSKLKRELEDKYFIQLLNEFSYIMPLNEIEEMKKTIDRGSVSTYSCPVTQSYIGNSLIGTPLIDAFSLENEDLLINGRDWQKDSIKRDRIDFFKKHGIDLGDDYNLYVANPECQKLIPTQELINKIANRKKELNELLLNEYYKSTSEYKTNRERIEEKGLLIKDDGYDANAYFNDSTFVNPNLTLVNGEYALSPIVCINNNIEEYLDVSVIHELNHVFELDFIKEEKGICEFVCGWDALEDSLNSTPEEIQSLQKRTKKREYELFNEIINELIAQEITTNMHNNGVYIFNNESNAKIKGGTSYENTLFLVRDFYKIYKNEILLSRRTGNMQVLFDKVGKENFDALNELFHEFYENLGGMKYYSLVNDVNSKKETDLTRKFFELISKRDAILTAMNEYSNEYQNENQK